MASEWCKTQKIRFGCFSLGEFSLSVLKFYNLGPILSKLHVSQTYVTTGTEQAEKTLKSMELQSGSQQQLISHCAGDKSQTHRAATTERQVGYRASQSAGSDRAPCHCNVPKVHFIQKAHLVFPIAIWGKFTKWKSISSSTPQAGVSPKWPTISLTWNVVCALYIKTLIW